MRIERIAVVGGGLIGASWAALFLAHGLYVDVYDPEKEAETGLRDFVARAWPDLLRLGMAQGAPALDRLSFHSDLAGACQDADFVQECGPDRIAIKRDIIAGLEASLGSDTVIASSTSSLTASAIQDGARHPGRILVAHPFNPPHLIPLVEIARGRQTADEAVECARNFYSSIGREVVIVRKEVTGHIANRLSSALFREAVHMVAEGIATVEDIDRAVAFGPGLRWALMGPYLTYHLGGGEGGFRHYMEHLGPTQAARWAELGDPVLDEALIQKLIAGVDAELAHHDADQLARQRDSGLVGLLELKKRLTLQNST